MSPARVTGEIAVVVGATGAIGQVIATRLAGCGLRVVAVARSASAVESLVSALDGARACVCDISKDSAIATIAAAIDAPVRAVVHGPGVQVAGGVLDAPTAAMVDAVNIKAGGLMRLVRAVDVHLQRGSRLIAIGGHYGLEPTAYAATAGIGNAALLNLLRQYSWAYGPRGITAHLIAPGPVQSERLRRVAVARAGRDGISAGDVLTQMQWESAIGAFTTPEQIAWGVETLLAPEADALAGSTLFMDAGRRRGLP